MILTELYQIDGKPMPVPDENVEMSFEDLDAAESGRDEAGFMHRIVVRSKVGVWKFCYSLLSREEYIYLRSILPQSGSFLFTHPDPDNPGESVSSRCYLSGYTTILRNAVVGDHRGLKFSIIQC